MICCGWHTRKLPECIVTQTKMNFRHVTIASLCILVIEMSAVGMFRAMVLNFWKIFNLPSYILSVFMMSWCSMYNFNVKH